MDKLLTLVILLCSLSSTVSLDIYCGFTFTEAGASFCVGIPVECEVYLDPGLCIEGVDIFTEDDLTVTITDSSIGSLSPSFNLTQNASVIYITADYLPVSNTSTITVDVMGNVTSMCTVDLSFTSAVQEISCDYQLSLRLAHSSSAFTVGYSFAIDEVFRVELQQPIPPGSGYFAVVAGKRCIVC